MPRKKKGEDLLPFTVLIDNREQKPWAFKDAPYERVTLETGDYTLKGLEKKFVCERKGALTEFATNVFQPRFIQELERLEEFEKPFVILEFTYEQLHLFPYLPEIPFFLRKKIKTKGPLILKRLSEFQFRYKTQFLPAGNKGNIVAMSLFKRAYEQWLKVD